MRISPERLGGQSLRQLGLLETMSLVEEHLSQVFGAPIAFSANWAHAGRGGVRVNPAIPELQVPAEAVWVPLDPREQYLQLEFTGHSDSAVSPTGAARTRDNLTGALRARTYDDGAYLAVVLVRGDGLLVPVSSAFPSWPENTKFIDAFEHETLFHLASQNQQCHDLIGCVLVNVGNAYRGDGATPQPVSMARLLDFNAVPAKSSFVERLRLSADSARFRRFPQFWGQPQPLYRGEWAFPFEAGGQVSVSFSHPGDVRGFRWKLGRDAPWSVYDNGNWTGTAVFEVPPRSVFMVEGPAVVGVELRSAGAGRTSSRVEPRALESMRASDSARYGTYTPERVRNAASAWLTGRLPTVQITEVMRQVPVLGTAVESLLSRPDAHARGWWTAADVLYSIMQRPEALAALVPELESRVPALRKAYSSRGLEGVIDVALSVEAKGSSAVCLLAAVQHVGLPAVRYFFERLSPLQEDEKHALWEAAAREAAQCAEALALSSRGGLGECRTPGELSHRFVPESTEDLRRLGVLDRCVRREGVYFVPLVRSGQLPAGTQTAPFARLSDREANVGHDFGRFFFERSTAAAPPFEAWSVLTPESLEAACAAGEAVSVAYVPVDQLVFDPFSPDAGVTALTPNLSREHVVLEMERGASPEAVLAAVESVHEGTPPTVPGVSYARAGGP